MENMKNHSDIGGWYFVKAKNELSYIVIGFSCFATDDNIHYNKLYLQENTYLVLIYSHVMWKFKHFIALYGNFKFSHIRDS